MLPGSTQRIIITVAAILVGLAFLWVGRSAEAADGSYAGSLLMAASPIIAIAAFAIVITVAIVPALIASATGNPLSGIFVLSAGLVFAASVARVDNWMRHVDLPGGYLWSAVELALWALPMVIIVQAVGRWRDRLRSALPQSMQLAHHASPPIGKLPKDNVLLATLSITLVLVVVGALFLQPLSWKPFMLALGVALGIQLIISFVASLVVKPDGEKKIPFTAMLGGVVCTAVGAGVLLLLLRSVQTPQVIAAIVAAFMFGSLAANQLFPRTPMIAIVLSPFCVGIGAFVITLFSYETSEQLLTAMRHTLNLTAEPNTKHLLSLAIAQPIHYASAGVAGVALGLGWSQSIRASHPAANPTPEATPDTA